MSKEQDEVICMAWYGIGRKIGLEPNRNAEQVTHAQTLLFGLLACLDLTESNCLNFCGVQHQFNLG